MSRDRKTQVSALPVVPIGQRPVTAKLWGRVPLSVKRVVLSLFKGRWTVSAGVVIRNEQGDVLLTRVRFRRHDPWSLPGGYLEGHETPEQAASREALEEAGVVIEVGRPLVVHRSSRWPELSVIYEGRILSGSPRAAAEIEELTFRPPSLLHEGFHDPVLAAELERVLMG